MDIQTKIEDLMNDIDTDLKICEDHLKNLDGRDDEFFKQRKIDLYRMKTIADIFSDIAEKL